VEQTSDHRSKRRSMGGKATDECETPLRQRLASDMTQQTATSTSSRCVTPTATLMALEFSTTTAPRISPDARACESVAECSHEDEHHRLTHTTSDDADEKV
jgi:hypothetical protein